MDYVQSVANFGSINRKYIESVFIVVLGTVTHLTSFDIAAWHFSETKKSQPNVASIVVTISILNILASTRPFWPSGMRPSSKILQFIIETMIILYVSDLLVRQVWTFIVSCLDHLCQAISRLMLTNPNGIKAKWMHTELFYIARFMAALIVFYYMLNVTGVLKQVTVLYKKYTMIETCAPDKRQSPILRSFKERGCSQTRRMNFNVADLPNVPDEGFDLATSVRDEQQRRIRKCYLASNGDNRFNNFIN